MSAAARLEICEVGARDGLQSLGVVLSPAERVSFLSDLHDAGLTKLEVGSLVNPKAVPEMAESDIVYREIIRRHPENKPQFGMLVPNRKGLDKALEIGCRYLDFFTATSDAFNTRNIRMTREESKQVIREMLRELGASRAEFRLRLYISTVFHCPYEGDQDETAWLAMFDDLLPEFEEISIGDTTGKGTPAQVNRLCETLEKTNLREKIWWHFHDTWMRAAENAAAAMAHGYTRFDSSAGGIGGCPFAPGAKGNIATEKLIETARSRGLACDLDITRIAAIAAPIVTKSAARENRT